MKLKKDEIIERATLIGMFVGVIVLILIALFGTNSVLG